MNRVNSREEETWQWLEERNLKKKRQKEKDSAGKGARHCNTHFLTLLSFTNAPNCPHVYFLFWFAFLFWLLKAVVVPTKEAHFIRSTQDLHDYNNSRYYCRTLIRNINTGAFIIKTLGVKWESIASGPWTEERLWKWKYRGREGRGFSSVLIVLFFFSLLLENEVWTLIAALKHPCALWSKPVALARPRWRGDNYPRTQCNDKPTASSKDPPPRPPTPSQRRALTHTHANTNSRAGKHKRTRSAHKRLRHPADGKPALFKRTTKRPRIIWARVNWSKPALWVFCPFFLQRRKLPSCIKEESFCAFEWLQSARASTVPCASTACVRVCVWH